MWQTKRMSQTKKRLRNDRLINVLIPELSATFHPHEDPDR